MDAADRTAGEVMGSPTETVSPETPLTTVKRRMEGETLRSLPVADGGKLVGIVRWRDLDAGGPARTAADVMLREFPQVRPDTPVSAILRQIHDIDIDLIPVVNTAGRLVGEIERGLIVHPEAPAAVVEAEASTTAAEDEEHVIHVETGMPVVDANGDDVGSVSAVLQDAFGRITHIQIEERHLLDKQVRRLPIDLVRYIRGSTVVLAVPHDHVDLLPDLDE